MLLWFERRGVSSHSVSVFRYQEERKNLLSVESVLNPVTVASNGRTHYHTTTMFHLKETILKTETEFFNSRSGDSSFKHKRSLARRHASSSGFRCLGNASITN